MIFVVNDKEGNNGVKEKVCIGLFFREKGNYGNVDASRTTDIFNIKIKTGEFSHSSHLLKITNDKDLDLSLSYYRTPQKLQR